VIEMSFQYGYFGTGFSVSTPPAEALRFRDLVQTRGEDITLIELMETGEDSYGQSVYSEASHTEKAFVERQGRERDLPPGTMKLGSLRLFMTRWAAVKEDGYEVEVDGRRYHVEAVTRTRAYKRVEAERTA